jgi:hypothetical protein
MSFQAFAQILAQALLKLWRLTHAILSVRINRVVSKPASRRVWLGETKEMFGLK